MFWWRGDRDLWDWSGNLLMAAGVAVWFVYAALRFGLGRPVEAGPFLPYHLAGVLPGMILRRRRQWRTLIRRLLRRE